MKKNSDYEAEIYDALLIKCHSPSLSKQCYASKASFLLNICTRPSFLQTRRCWFENIEIKPEYLASQIIEKNAQHGKI